MKRETLERRTETMGPLRYLTRLREISYKIHRRKGPPFLLVYAVREEAEESSPSGRLSSSSPS
jgi:hypothetical protein